MAYTDTNLSREPCRLPCSLERRLRDGDMYVSARQRIGVQDGGGGGLRVRSLKDRTGVVGQIKRGMNQILEI